MGLTIGISEKEITIAPSQAARLILRGVDIRLTHLFPVNGNSRNCGWSLSLGPVTCYFKDYGLKGIVK